MIIENMRPADQLILTIDRIYKFGMTTTTGGNISICDSDGDIWITPGGIDKGSLTREDIVRVKPDGTIIGKHKPSMELPFHSHIYKLRQDIKAIVHAHPPALVAFSLVRRLPDTRLYLNAFRECGRVDFVEYALPGSKMLGEKVARVIENDANTAILENHGAITVGEDLHKAFKRFETLDFCARTEINANIIGTPSGLTGEEVSKTAHYEITEEFEYSNDARLSELRKEICSMAKRAYLQGLFTSTSGVISHRVEGNSFLITPEGFDGYLPDEDELVLIKYGKREKDKLPNSTFSLHKRIYEEHPEVNSVMAATPPSAMAFAVTEEEFDSKTIPESYMVLRNLSKLPFNASEESISKAISERMPVMLIRNKCALVTGVSLIKAFDRLEVLDYSARSLISARNLGGKLSFISKECIDEIDEAFKLK